MILIIFNSWENELLFFENESSLAEYKQINMYVRVVSKMTNNPAKDYWVERKYVLRFLSRIIYPWLD